jgi:hypothetical protein
MASIALRDPPTNEAKRTSDPDSDADTDADIDGPSSQRQSLQALFERRRAQKSKKQQPWKQTYQLSPEDVSKTNSMHDVPWFHPDDFAENADSASGN